MMKRAVVIGGLWLTACGPKAEPAKTAEPEPVASATAAAAPEPAPSAVPATSEAPQPAASAAEPKPAAPSIHELCFAMCDKLKDKCPKSSWETCRINCSKYESPSDGCEDVVRSALSCARDASDLVCAAVAPESCAKQFRHISSCNAGKKPVEEAVASTALPSGFAIYENAAEGIHAPMPEGVTAGEANVIATVKTTDGAVYSIRKLPRPEGKLNEKVFLKIGMNLFGRCSDKMKMQGMVDKPGRTSINYTTKCPDGSEEKGLFWATEKALFVASARGPAGSLGPTEAFLYGFEIK
ncbi:MAG TPA: hypothetical protein VHB79_26140 [Polyangiaceae bacterium]|nr:hypothetical protein [Polyangiaceae bacterium]